MGKMLVALAVTIAASILMGSFIALTATGKLTTVPDSSLPDAVLTLEMTDDDIPLSSGRYTVTRPDFFSQQVSAGMFDASGTSRIGLKAGIAYTITVYRKDTSLCRVFDVELMEGAAASLGCD